MGWTTMRLPAEGARAYLDRHCYSYDTPERRLTVLRSTIVGKQTYYAACRLTDKINGGVIVFAGVAKVSFHPGDEYDFGYKTMTEDMGPCEAQCPKAILDMLSAPENDYARDWRSRCRAHLAGQAAIRSKPQLVAGEIIRFAEPITFSDGAVLDTFTIVERRGARPTIAFRGNNGGFYRISNARAREFTLSNVDDLKERGGREGGVIE